jgi:hypothetical protein
MVDRVTVRPGGRFEDYSEKGGHGQFGQIKKATENSWNALEINGQWLNKGSLIDYLNTKLAPQEQLSKGFFGIGGARKETVTSIFHRVTATVPASHLSIIEKYGQLSQIPSMKLPSIFGLTADQIQEKKGICLARKPLLDSPSAVFRGIALTFEEKIGPILRLCPGMQPFSSEEINEMMEEVVEELAKQDITPAAFVTDGRFGPEKTTNNFTTWQRGIKEAYPREAAQPLRPTPPSPSPPQPETLVQFAARIDRSQEIPQQQITNQLRFLSRLPQQNRADLPKGTHLQNFTGFSQERIEARGAVCLVANRQNTDSPNYRGIVLSREKHGDVLHLCADVRMFTVKEYREMMEEAAKELLRLGSRPVSFVTEARFGQYVTSSTENFQQWQQTLQS